MKTADFLDKAARAAASARLLPNAGDIDGACNRACYAMFDAARAALLLSAGDASEARTHSGLIAAFGLNLARPGGVSVELGKALNGFSRFVRRPTIRRRPFRQRAQAGLSIRRTHSSQR